LAAKVFILLAPCSVIFAPKLPVACFGALLQAIRLIRRNRVRMACFIFLVFVFFGYFKVTDDVFYLQVFLGRGGDFWGEGGTNIF